MLRPSGQITIGSGVDALRSAVEKTLEEGTRRVVVDLSAVNYIDSAALGELAASRRRTVDEGGRFALAGLQGKVRDLVELTRLDTMIDVYLDAQEAVEGLDD